MIKKIHWLFYILLTLSIALSCKKDIIAVYMDVRPGPGQVTEQDTVQIRYTVHGANADSVCLFVNSAMVESQIGQENKFFYKTNSHGDYTFKVVAYKSGELEESKPVKVNVRKLKSPDLTYQISRVDDEPTYFIGEQLKITVLPQWDYQDIYDFKKITLYFEDEVLGTKTSPPFTFETPVIVSTENNLIVELTDENGRIHHIPYLLTVSSNIPPEINLGLYYNSGHILSTTGFSIKYSGSDNVKVDYIDFYLNQQYHSTHIINSGYFNHEDFEIDTLQAGDHEIYCIAYDDRNDSTISNTYNIKISKAIILDYEIVDVDYTNNDTIAYAISEYKLLRINPVKETVSKYIDLPFLRATSIDYEPVNSRLYIGFEGGEMIYWDNDSESFITIAEAAFPTIEDIEVEYTTNMAVVISNQKVYAFNITTFSKKMGDVELIEEATLAMNRNNKRIVVGGGKSGINSDRYHKFELRTDTLYHEASSTFGGNSKKIIMNPTRDEFLLRNSRNIYLYDLNFFGSNLGQYVISYPKAASFSIDGSTLFAGTNSEKDIYMFDSESLTRLNKFRIPLSGHNQVNHIIPTIDNAKIVLTTNDVFYDYYKLIFLRIGE